MRWYVKKQSEDDKSIFINYSYEKNDTCDGLLKFDKGERKFEIVEMSEGADDFATRWVFPHIRGLITNNELNGEKRKIAVG
jgi:hypothetical protein